MTDRSPLRGGADEVFKALADPTRRSLLGELDREDGQTLHQLEARFAITRVGVMKHLKQLEEAEAYSRVTWEIEPVGDSCRLTVVHDQMRDGACEQLYGG